MESTPGLDRVLRGLVAMAMDGDFLPQPMRFIDQRRHFRRGQLRRIHFVRHRQDAARDRGLDHIGAVFDLEPDRFADRVRSIGNPVRGIRFAGRRGGHESRPCRRSDRRWRRCPYVATSMRGPRNDSFRDRIAQRDIDKIAAASKRLPRSRTVVNPASIVARAFGMAMIRELGDIQLQTLQAALVDNSR